MEKVLGAIRHHVALCPLYLSRCLYLGQAFAGAGRTAEAHAVLGLAVSEADAALAALNKVKDKQKQVRQGGRERVGSGVKGKESI